MHSIAYIYIYICSTNCKICGGYEKILQRIFKVIILNLKELIFWDIKRVIFVANCTIHNQKYMSHAFSYLRQVHHD